MRGYRSNCNIYEESRMIPKEVRDSILSPFLISRQAPFLKKPEYAHLKTEPIEMSISSAWFKSLEHFWEEIRMIGEKMINGADDHLCIGLDYLLAIHHGLKTERQMTKEKEKSNEISFAIEYENQMFDSEGSFFTYDLFEKARKVKKVLCPRFPDELVGNKKIRRLNKKDGVVRILSCDIAMSSGRANDNSIYTLAELIPMKGYYQRKVVYIESHNGRTAVEQALRIRRLVADFQVDVLVLDVMGVGIPVLDLLGTSLTDEETGEEYTPLCAYNDDELKARCRMQNAIPMIYGIKANLQLNSDMVVEMKNLFQQNKVHLPISEIEADEFLSKTNEQYKNSETGSQYKVKNLSPYIETNIAINECIQLETELRQGKVVVKEKGANRKDRFSSLLYLLWVSTIIEKENFNDDNIEWEDINWILT